MNLKCKFHNSETIERICASARWKMEPALCWQCMVDQSDHVKEHKDQIVKIDEFISRISKEFAQLSEVRKKDQKYAFPDYKKLAEESGFYIESYKYVIDKRKIWVYNVIQKIINEFTAQCAQLQENINQMFDDKLRHYEDQVTFVKSCIELRYGLVPLPNEEQIRKKLEQIGENDEDCNPYIRDLKDMLLPPLELEKNLSFVESLAEFEQLKDIADKIQRDIEDKKDQEGEEDEEFDQSVTDILQEAKDQCAVLLEEVKNAVSTRDPILNRKVPKYDQDTLNESIQSQISPPELYQSQQSRSTFAKKLYETSPLQDKSNKAPFISQQLSSQTQKQQISTESPIKVLSGQTYIQLDCRIRTDQGRGITSIVQIGPDCFATASKDKTIRVIFSKAPHENFTLLGHTDQITALCMFNNKLLVSGGGNLDSSLIVWSLSNRKQVHTLQGHQSGITCITDLQDGISIVSGSYDNHAIIWNANEGEAVCALRKHTAMISCIGLTQRRDYILTGSWDRTMGMWEIQYEARQRTVKGAKYLREIKTDGAVLCIQMVGDKYVAYGGTSNKVILMDWSNSEVKRKFSTSQFGVCELSVFDNILIGLGGSDSTIRVWDMKSQENQEAMVHRDPQNIYINNNNTSKKMIDIGSNKIAIINNNDKNPHFDIFKLNYEA